MENVQMAVIEDTYTAKELKFCGEYCIDLNATKAAIRTGYSQKTAGAISCRLLMKVNIQKKIKEIQNDLAKAAGISALRAILEHKKIAFSNIGDYFADDWSPKELELLSEEQRACIQEAKTKDTKGGKEVNVKLFSKAASLDAICKLLGFYTPVKNEITGKDGKPLATGTVIILPEKRDLSLLDNEELKVYSYLLEKISGKDPWGKWAFTFQNEEADAIQPGIGNSQQWDK